MTTQPANSDASEAHNFIKMHILLTRACSCLQETFVRSWKIKTGHDWDQSQGKVILKYPLRNISKHQRTTIEEGDVSQWDITTLQALLCADNLFDLPNGQKEQIRSIVDVRNYVSHLPKNAVGRKQFDELWRTLEIAVIEFGVPDTELEQLKQETRVSGVEFTVQNGEAVDESDKKEAALLKENGNAAFKIGNYSRAVELYTKAIILNGIPSEDRAVLLSNRTISYLKLHDSSSEEDHLRAAKDDAEHLVKLRPDWWKGYCRLAQVCMGLKDYENAIDNATKSFAIEPKNQEIDDLLSSARRLQGQYKRMDFLDPIEMKFLNKESHDRNVLAELNINVGKHEKLEELRYELEMPDLAINCLLGHRYKYGTSGYPRDCQQAAKYFRIAADGGNAEGMFNLGKMMLDGDGVKQDIKEGLKWLQKAAAQPPFVMSKIGNEIYNIGVAAAQHLLGLCYSEGTGVDKNRVKAMDWYKKGSLNGCPFSANNLGGIYENELIDWKHDLVKAEQYYRLAASNPTTPDCNAMANLARLYCNKGDLERALDWCRRAKANGNRLSRLDHLTSQIEDELKRFQQSPIISWELKHGLNSDGLTVQQRKDRWCAATSKGLFYLNEQQKLLKSRLLNETGPNICTKDFDPFEFQRHAKHSEYARKMWTARKHCLNAMKVMKEMKDGETPSLTNCQKVVEDLSAYFQIDDLVDLPPYFQAKANSIVNMLMKKEAITFDEDVRICYVALLGVLTTEECIPFLDECIYRYPLNVFFIETRANMKWKVGCLEDGIRDTILALKLDPEKVDVLCDQADMMMLSETFKPEDTIAVYEKFLKLAPDDHRKVPEALYAMALVNMKQLVANASMAPTAKTKYYLTEIKKYYDLGVSAEQRQLSMFLPYVSNIKFTIECLVSSMLLSPVTEPEEQIVNDELMQKLTDPNRILMVRHHRKAVGKRTGILPKCNFSYEPSKTQQLPRSLAGLKPISLGDMDPTTDEVYEGFILSVTVIDDLCCTGASICTLLEDTNGYVERCFIYNSSNVSNVDGARAEFRIGCRMSIINPYRRKATDKRPAIRIDDPASIVFEGFAPEMCRYCCKLNASQRCGRCKVALYCNRTCQKMDWKDMQHELICFKPVVNF